MQLRDRRNGNPNGAHWNDGLQTPRSGGQRQGSKEKPKGEEKILMPKWTKPATSMT